MAKGSFDISDEDLMKAYQRGEEKAFAELFQRHKNGVYSYIYRYTNSSEESDEVFQEVFIKLHRATPTYEPTAKFTTWLYTIVRNLCIDSHRKRKLRNHLSLDYKPEEEGQSFYDVIPSKDFTPDERSADLEVGRILEQALQHINEDQREVFLMRAKLGLKFEEIAETMKVSVNTVKSRMRYAVESLKKQLEKSGFKDLDPNLER